MGYPLGPENWPIWLRKLLPGKRKFYYAASAHDWLYSLCKDESDRKKADMEFLILCLEESTSFGWELLSLTYYLLVRIGGRNRIGK